MTSSEESAPADLVERAKAWLDWWEGPEVANPPEVGRHIIRDIAKARPARASAALVEAAQRLADVKMAYLADREKRNGYIELGILKEYALRHHGLRQALAAENEREGSGSEVPDSFDVAEQLFLNGPTWDGDIICKEGRDALVKQGMVDRLDGFQWLNHFGMRCVLAWDRIGPHHKDRIRRERAERDPVAKVHELLQTVQAHDPSKDGIEDGVRTLIGMLQAEKEKLEKANFSARQFCGKHVGRDNGGRCPVCMNDERVDAGLKFMREFGANSDEGALDLARRIAAEKKEACIRAHDAELELGERREQVEHYQQLIDEITVACGSLGLMESDLPGHVKALKQASGDDKLRRLRFQVGSCQNEVIRVGDIHAKIDRLLAETPETGKPEAGDTLYREGDILFREIANGRGPIPDEKRNAALRILCRRALRSGGQK